MLLSSLLLVLRNADAAADDLVMRGEIMSADAEGWSECRSNRRRQHTTREDAVAVAIMVMV